MRRNNARKQLLDHITEWKQSPLAFVGAMWPQAELEPFQQDALTALAEHGRVSIRSGHGVGKSTLDSWAILWFMTTHFPAKVPCTAPTKHQIEDVLHAEIAKWLQTMPAGYSGLFELKKERLELREAPAESFVAFRTGNKANPEALQGFHSDNLLFVLDEASGIDDGVFEVAEGALSTPDAKVLMTSNPTRRQGYFYESHHRNRDHWHTVKVSCKDSRRVAPEYIESMSRYGATSNIFKVRVLGEFPVTDDDAVIPLDIIEAAVGREVEATTGAPIVWGVDVARFGSDRSALAKRQGNTLLEPIVSKRQYDTMQVSGWIADEYKQAHDDKPSVILVDVIGLGAGVVDRLKELDLPVRGVNVAERPSSKDRFMRLRDEVWFAGRDWFDERDCTMPDDPALIAELSSISYKLESSGKIKVESKEEMKKAGRNSPDLADAFLLTFAGPVQPVRRQRKPLEYRVVNIR